MQVNYDNYA